MIIGTFGASTAWVGRTVTYDGHQFAVEEVGPTTPQAVLQYVQQGHLAWASEETRGLTMSLAQSPAVQPQGSAPYAGPQWKQTHRWLGTPRQLIILAVLFVVLIILWTSVSQMH